MAQCVASLWTETLWFRPDTEAGYRDTASKLTNLQTIKAIKIVKSYIDTYRAVIKLKISLL